MFVCTSICLGETITISGDIVDHAKVRKLERELKPVRINYQHLHQQQNNTQELRDATQYLQRVDNYYMNSNATMYQQLLELEPNVSYLQDRMTWLDQQLYKLEQNMPKVQELEKQLESEQKYSDIAGNGNPNKYPDEHKYGKALEVDIWKNPNNNHLIIRNPNAKVGNAYGAKMNKASVNKNRGKKDFLSMTNNEVIVSGGEFACGDTNGYIAGAWADDIDGNMTVSSNTVIITGGSKIGNVYGGRAYNGTVSSSTVRIEGVPVCDVYGGHIVNNGTAIENKVNLTSVTVKWDVYGALIGKFGFEDEKVGEYGLASSNTVTITSGTVRNVFGGYIVRNGTAIENKVNLTSGTATNDVYGALIGEYGLASSNTVTITSGTVGGNVYGGDIVKNGTATENEVNLTSGTVRMDVYGARIGSGLASSNTVTITSGTVGLNVYGGYIVNNGTATLNTVNLTSVTVSSDVYGARIGDGLASSNTVTITSGKVRNVYGGYIVKDGTATLNTVNLTSVTVRMDVYGAWIGNDGRRIRGKAEKVGGDVLASSNTVTITSGTVGWNVFGGYIVKNGTAILNKVNLSDVDVTRDVYGAQIGMGLASSNEVTITGGRVGGDVLGGYVYNDGTATGNKVNLSDVNVTRNVYGAMVGTDKKAEFERADEAMTEAFERVLAPLDKFERAEEAEFEREREATRVEAEKAVIAAEAFERVLDYLDPTVKVKAEAEFKLGRNREVKPADFREVSYTLVIFAEYNKYSLDLKEKTEIDEFVGDVKEKINKSEAVRAKFKKYVIAEIERAEAKRAKTYVLASSNTVTITSGKVRNVYGGYIVRNGTATLNTVNLTGVTATKDVYGAWIGNDGLASSNEVTIINGETVQNVYGGYIVKDGTATGNTVTISGGKIKGNVFGGYVGGNGQATYNTINITGNPEFSTSTILCGGICANADKNDAVTGNTLNIETKGVVVKGISNFEKYKFHLKDIKTGETILTATSGGYNEANKSACEMDLSRSNISLHTQGVLNKGDQYTLIKSPHGFEGKVKTKQFDFENEGLLIKYYWNIKIADNKQELIAKLIDKKIRDGGVARSLSEGYGAGVACVNNGMDCIFSKMEETEEQSSKEQSPKLLLGLQRKGEIGAFGGLAASKSKYDIDKGSHIDMIGMSMMGGVGKVVEVREKELTVGVFVEHGTGNIDIHCENKNEGKSKYVGGGLLGRYNIYENEFSGTKAYVEAILRAGQIDNSFNIKKAKDGTVKEYKYEYADAMYGGCAVGGGYKHKVSEKIDLDWSLRYMFGYQDGKGAKQADADGNKAKFESVTSNRIRIGVRGKYVELEKVKPYAGIGCECELSGKVRGTIQNGADMIDMPVSDFGGVTGIGELGVSGKIWKFGVDISGQGYLGVRKGFGGMLKLKYAFGKDAHGSLASSKASSKAPRS